MFQQEYAQLQQQHNYWPSNGLRHNEKPSLKALNWLLIALNNTKWALLGTEQIAQNENHHNKIAQISQMLVNAWMCEVAYNSWNIPSIDDKHSILCT